jgi:hypothetical protein
MIRRDENEVTTLPTPGFIDNLGCPQVGTHIAVVDMIVRNGNQIGVSLNRLESDRAIKGAGEVGIHDQTPTLTIRQRHACVTIEDDLHNQVVR